ncbi:MAG: hypothetical protein JWL77_560 [Chthonomonadaceae bacterium]|nr:hypothetical protein [Chthonomonadaceae bacterium]
MTLVACVKVNDGVVLAADSALTMVVGSTPDGRIDAANLYNNANKIFNLCRGLPLGLLTWGSLVIGGVSVSNLVKEYRQQVQVADASAPSQAAYTVYEMAKNLLDFLEVRFKNPYNGQPENETFNLGLLIAGYNPGAERAEEYIAGLRNEKQADGSLLLILEGPTLIKYQGKAGPDIGAGVYVNGQPEAAQRLIRGYGPILNPLFDDIVPNMPDPAERTNWENAQRALFSELADSRMPIQDAIDLSVFLIETTTKYLRFLVGPQTVGGPVEVAAITKYEGFQWVQRKYYYNRELNP